MSGQQRQDLTTDNPVVCLCAWAGVHVSILPEQVAAGASGPGPTSQTGRGQRQGSRDSGSRGRQPGTRKPWQQSEDPRQQRQPWQQSQGPRQQQQQQPWQAAGADDRRVQRQPLAFRPQQAPAGQAAPSDDVWTEPGAQDSGTGGSQHQDAWQPQRRSERQAGSPAQSAGAVYGDSRARHLLADQQVPWSDQDDVWSGQQQRLPHQARQSGQHQPAGGFDADSFVRQQLSSTLPTTTTFFVTCHPGLEQCVEEELLHPRVGAQRVILGKAGVYFR